MQEILELYYNTNRPVVKLDSIFNGCAALIDTGASFPVWTKEIELLQALGATLVKETLNHDSLRFNLNHDSLRFNPGSL